MCELINTIEAQIDANIAGQNWGKHYLQKEKFQSFNETLVKNRMELKHIKYALEKNPAAAVFGESQVGKSYLVDNLLASKKGPLYIFDGRGNKYSFIDKINPLGNGKESTSLVSRFTTKKAWVNDDYPVKAYLLSPSDIVLMLCDTYFNDVKIRNCMKPEELRSFVEDILNRYEGEPSVQKHITDVELYEIRHYFFEQDVLGGQGGELFRNALKTERYFEKIANVIEAVSPDQWVYVFSILWGKEERLTEVFCKLINTYSQLNFKQEVYFKIDAILREYGTLLHVDRLFELFGVAQYEENGKTIDVEIAKVQDMAVWNGEKKVTLQKSEMCALTAEVILKADEDLETEKPFLKQLDLLDFPGARSRKLEELPLSQSLACQLLIRGKVAFLFNKYSQQYLISNLLFCHHRELSNVSTLSGLLKGWVDTMVGKTVNERSDYMQMAQISPLFLIGTKFNVDMKKDDKDISVDPETRNANKIARWNTRFNNLSNVIGNADWFTEWQKNGASNEPFKNVYLLRSYNFSFIDNIYKGYKKRNEDGTFSLNCDDNGNVIGETALGEDYIQFIPEIRESFLANSFVKEHFANPEESWFEGTGVDKEGKVWPFHDGSDFIIENLTRSCQQVQEMRDKKFNKKINDSMHQLCQTLGGQFHDDDSDSALKEALNDAGEINLLLAALFGADKYFFSEFIDKILIRENELVDVVLGTIKSNVMIKGTDLSMLFAIREEAKINPEQSVEENRRRLREKYHKTSDKELDEELIKIGKTILNPKRGDDNPLTVDEIINPPMVKNFAGIIVDDVVEYWLEQHLQLDSFAEFVNRGMSFECIDKLLRKMNVLFRDKLCISVEMTDSIQKYVVNPISFTVVAEMVADICAEKINRFVNTMGAAYFNGGHWKSLKDTVEHNKFDINVEKRNFDNVEFDAKRTKNGLKDVFDVFDNVDTVLNQVPVDYEKLSYFSNYQAYREWIDLMKLAFLATCDIPTYDVDANDALRKILRYIVESPVLGQMLTLTEYEQYHMMSLIPTENMNDNHKL